MRAYSLKPVHKRRFNCAVKTDLAPLYDLVDQANELIRQINEFDVEFEDEPVKKKEPEQPQPIVTTQLVYRTMNRKNLG